MANEAISAMPPADPLDGSELFETVQSSVNKQTTANDIKTFIGSSGGNTLYPAFTAPINGDFGWVNQGGASVDTTGPGIYLNAPVQSGEDLRIRNKAIPGSTFTLIAGVIPNFQNENGFPNVGIGFRESGSGKIHLVRFVAQQGNNVAQASVDHYTSPTSGSNITQLHWGFSGMVWFKIQQDSTNRILSIGSDGANFFDLHTEGKTTFLTADEIFWEVSSISGTWQAGARLLSWQES